MKARVAAVAARTPVGTTAESFSGAVRAGISRVRAHPRHLDGSFNEVLTGDDRELPVMLPAADRIIALAEAALYEIVRKAETFDRASKTKLFVGLPEARPGLAEDEDVSRVRKDLLELADAYALSDPTFVPTRGHAAGLEALRQAAAYVDERPGKWAVALGADSMVSYEAIQSLAQRRRIYVRDRNSGFIVGEGATAVLVTSEPWATEGLHVLGSGATVEKDTVESDGDVKGERLAQAINEAWADSSEPVGWVICDINGERYRTQEWTMCLLRMDQILKPHCPLWYPAQSTGDMGAGGSLAGVVLAYEAFARGWSLAPEVLVYGASDGGARAAIRLGPAGGKTDGKRS